MKQVSVWALGISLALSNFSASAPVTSPSGEAAQEAAEDLAQEEQGEAPAIPPMEAQQTPPPIEISPTPVEGKEPLPRPPSRRALSRPKLPRTPPTLTLPITANRFYDEKGALITDQFGPHVLQLIEVPLERSAVNLDQESDNLWVRGDRPSTNFLAWVKYFASEEAEIALEDGTSMRVYAAKRNSLYPSSKKAPDDLITKSAIYCGVVKGAPALAPTMCFHDSDDDKRFDRIAIGRSEAVDRHPIGAAVMFPSAMLQTPLAYTPVSADARTELNFEFRNCGRDWDRPRFSVSRKKEPLLSDDALGALLGDPQLEKTKPAQRTALLNLVRGSLNGGRSNSASCRRGDRIESFGTITEKSLDKKHILTDLDGLIFSIGPKKGGAPVKLLAAREASGKKRLEGGVLQPVDSGLSRQQRTIATAQEFDRSPFMSTGEITVAEGTVGLDKTLFEVPFEYGYMGELSETSNIRTILTSRSVKGGTLLYGIPMSARLVTTYNGIPTSGFGGRPMDAARGLSTQLTWCTPTSKEKNVYKKDNRGKSVPDGTKTVWSATCFSQVGDRHSIVKGQSPAYAVSRMSHTANISTNDGKPPVTRLERTNFGQPAKLRYFFDESDKGRLRLMQEVMIGDVATGAKPVEFFYGAKAFGEKDGRRKYAWRTAGGLVTVNLLSGYSAEAIGRKDSKEEKAAKLSAEREQWSFEVELTKPAEKEKPVNVHTVRQFSF
ncbi:MAG: hypothetical protein ABJP34_07380 [Erythrobacter sp.]